MPITATYDGATDRLTVIGDLADDTIAVTHDLASNLLVNGAAVPGIGGTPTVSNTVRIDVFGGGGDDTLSVDDLPTIVASIHGDDGDDMIIANGTHDTLDGGAGNDALWGGNGRDKMNGGDGNDRLDGGAGIDTMAGGLGNDQFYVDQFSDHVIETAGEGDDRIFTRSNYTLAAGLSVETLSTDNVIGTTALVLIGNQLANNIYGNHGNNSLYGSGGNDVLIAHDGNDTLNGGAGSDTMIGGLGDDWFYVDTAADVVSELAGQGADRVFASASYALAAGVSIETLSTDNTAGTTAITLSGNELANQVYGNAGNNSLYGGDGNDVIFGEAGNDTLNGGAGSDTMAGGLGDDWYYVNSSTDVVSETAGQGTDRVITTSNFVLGAGISIETVSTDNTTATTAIMLIGNELANNLYGNYGANNLRGGGGNDVIVAHDGNDTLDGGTGADSLNGGLGDDIYYLDSAADTVSESSGGGNDRVFASASYVLAAGVSVETLSTNNAAATVALDLTGNDLANNIYGNYGANYLRGGGGSDVIIAHDGNDTLDGGAGTDSLSGGVGDDSYYVDSASDTVNESAAQGNDRVFAGASFTLAAGLSVETLSTNNVVATAAIDLTGNELANNVYGNNGDNYLRGGGGSDVLIAHSGADTLDGGAGADMLTGGAGGDTFRFTTALGGANVDTIQDYSFADDTFQLDDAVFAWLPLGVLAPGTFVEGTAAADADDRIIHDQASGALWFDADGTGAGAAVQFAWLLPSQPLAASEFVVI